VTHTRSHTLPKKHPTKNTDASRRAFYKAFKSVVAAADVIIQVLDARDPAACRCPDVERYVRAAGSDKRVVLLLNKMDLVPREAGEAWLKHLREELPTVAFKSSTQQQATGLQQSGGKGGKGGGGGKKGGSVSAKDEAAAAGAGGGVGSGCLGADTLLALLKNYARSSAGGKGSIAVGVVGLPNVGKSSVINSLKRARVASVGNTPGVTRGVQEVHLDKSIKLLDSPGELI
jgi:nuclear GTP-binding protein